MYLNDDAEIFLLIVTFLMWTIPAFMYFKRLRKIWNLPLQEKNEKHGELRESFIRGFYCASGIIFLLILGMFIMASDDCCSGLEDIPLIP